MATLVKAAASLGGFYRSLGALPDSEAFLTYTEEWKKYGFRGEGTLALGLDKLTYDEYFIPTKEVDPPDGPAYSMVENAIYSQTGSWGLICSHEFFGVLGARNEFISCFLEHYRPNDIDCSEFVNLWLENNKTWDYCIESWLPGLIEHIYEGAEPCHLPKSLTEEE
jgi:hypothetical protein